MITNLLFIYESNRGAVDESGEHFVAYFLPTGETLNKRKRDEEEQEDFVEDEE